MCLQARIILVYKVTNIAYFPPQHLSVLESMNVAADLKLGERMTQVYMLYPLELGKWMLQGEKDLVVGEVLDNLGLTECRNTR